MDKKCNKCQIIQSYTNFTKFSQSKDKLYSICKTCLKAHTFKNRKKLNKYNKLYYLKNKEKIREKHKNYYINNKEKINIQVNNYRKTLDKNEENKRINKYQKKRRKTDTNYRLRHNLRARLTNAIKGNFKSGSFVKDLGCSIEEFKLYIESKFQLGMTWENWGKYTWHLDHITPLNNFDLTNREELLKACNYKNIQPLWAKDNHRKSDK